MTNISNRSRYNVQFGILISTMFISSMAIATECPLAPSSIETAVTPLLGNVSYDTAKAHPWILDTIQHTECCKTDSPQLGCPQSIKKFEPLESPESGFNAKVEALLGQMPPTDFIKNGDPNAPLDFSKAPKLKSVYLSSLVFRSDFYGTVMARLLKYQADHGALVNIVTTDYMEKHSRWFFIQRTSRSFPISTACTVR